MKHLTNRETKVPGPRLEVTLRIAEASLPELLAGIEPERCWLTDEGDGYYGFHATQSIGTSRQQAGKPAADILVELLNAFADELDGEDVPQRLRDRWDAVVDEYAERTAPASTPPGEDAFLSAMGTLADYQMALRVVYELLDDGPGNAGQLAERMTDKAEDGEGYDEKGVDDAFAILDQWSLLEYPSLEEDAPVALKGHNE